MKVLITGGAGFLGINLVRHLFTKGVKDIRVFDILPFDYPEKERVEENIGDIRNTDAISHAMKNVDIVIHTAAALPLYKKQDIFSTDIGGTKCVLEAAYENSVQRVIHISSTAVYGIPTHHPLYEDDPLVGVGPYGEAKIMAEEICLEYRTKGMCVPIIRPKSFVGPERLGVFALLYDWALDGKNFPIIGSGKNQYQFLDVEDLCEAIWITMTAPSETVNETFNIGAKRFCTLREDYQSVLDAAGFGKKVIGFPATPAIWALRTLEFFHLSPIYKWVYETAGRDSFVSIEKAEKILGFSPQHSNQEALLRNFSWYKANCDAIKNSCGVNHRSSWKQGFIKLLKPFF